MRFSSSAKRFSFSIWVSDRCNVLEEGESMPLEPGQFQFDHERLDVYRLSISFASWAYKVAREMKGADRYTKDQLLRASQSIPLNIAEGNGKRSGLDRSRFFQIALGSCFECAAILDVMFSCDVMIEEECRSGKDVLHRIAGMLVRLSEKVEQVREDTSRYGQHADDAAD
jgi:four helix bundle protein